MLHIEGDDHPVLHLSGTPDASDRAALLAKGRELVARKQSATLDLSGLDVWDLASFQLVIAIRRDVSAVGEQVWLRGHEGKAGEAHRALGLNEALSSGLHWEVF